MTDHRIDELKGWIEMNFTLYVLVEEIKGGWHVSVDTTESQEHHPISGWCGKQVAVPQRIKECCKEVISQLHPSEDLPL